MVDGRVEQSRPPKAAVRETVDPKVNGEPLSSEDLRQAVAKDRAAREKACWQDIAAVLAKHKCRLGADPHFVEGRTFAHLVMSLDE